MKTSATPDLWQKILVPTDFSECAEAAVHFAAALHQKSGAEIILLHVTEPAYQGLRVQTSDLHAQMRHAAENSLKKLATEAFSNATSVRVVVRDGRPADVICQSAADEKADAIIIPTHGHSGLKHALLGSVAEKVVRHAPCSVLVVRE
ncbi:universal stress protein [Prosthecobacter sp.]|uniref:universal stress protein n=1 Tax=Prosthecobacter sp. TaxID=1965333 RepID=UPI002ABBAE07|nr:universal stress protein [Prosthecobacter sp.]MDZ4403583.1 universal stress protein [Prosthecobacter sp.]